MTAASISRHKEFTVMHFGEFPTLRIDVREHAASDSPFVVVRADRDGCQAGFNLSPEEAVQLAQALTRHALQLSECASSASE